MLKSQIVGGWPYYGGKRECRMVLSRGKGNVAWDCKASEARGVKEGWYRNHCSAVEQCLSMHAHSRLLTACLRRLLVPLLNS